MAHAAAQTRAAQLPAPRTIAPSREDVLSNLAFFFGDPVVSCAHTRRLSSPSILASPSDLFRTNLYRSPSACATTRSTTPCKQPPAPTHATRLPLCVHCSILTRFPIAVRRTFHFPGAPASPHEPYYALHTPHTHPGR
jgi:hypothetical protein